MYSIKSPEYKLLMNEINTRGNKTKEEFYNIIQENIREPILLKMIKNIQDIFSDNYRSALISLSCEAIGGNPNDTLSVSVLINLVSAAFGIHDDIIDNSTTKKFRNTLFGLHGHDNSLTFGDYLLIKTLNATSQLLESKLSIDVINRVLKEFGNLYSTLIEGELMEINSRKNLDIDLDYCHSMMWKISIDGETCVKLGSIIGKGTNNQILKMSKFGKRLGYLWRLYDDVEDILNLNGKLPARLQYESIPLPLLYAAKLSEPNYRLISSIIKKTTITKEDVFKLLDICFESKSFEYVNKIAIMNNSKALDDLYSIKDSDARNFLELMLKQATEKIDYLCI